MTGPEIHTLVGAGALDAVDDLERASFDRHLADCETCANCKGLRARSAPRTFAFCDISLVRLRPGDRGGRTESP